MVGCIGQGELKMRIQAMPKFRSAVFVGAGGGDGIFRKGGRGIENFKGA